MKKQLPVILLVLVSTALLAALFSAKREIKGLKQDIAGLQKMQKEAGIQIPDGYASRLETVVSNPAAAAVMQSEEQMDGQLIEKDAPAADSKRRIMSDMAKVIEENPTISKMVEAGQRGTIGALYADLIEYLDLNAEETTYFMDVLMHRQMAHVDVHLKMMSGDLAEEEKQALMEKVRLASETTRNEMEKFLNDPDDFAEFEFYEDTIGERMLLSQMDQQLGEDALDDGTYREVLAIMHNERENYTWRTDLYDQENRDLSPERFSEENIRTHMEDVRILGKQMDQRVQGILTPEQLEAWRASGVALQGLVEGQLRQAHQLYGEE